MRDDHIRLCKMTHKNIDPTCEADVLKSEIEGACPSVLLILCLDLIYLFRSAVLPSSPAAPPPILIYPSPSLEFYPLQPLGERERGQRQRNRDREAPAFRHRRASRIEFLRRVGACMRARRLSSRCTSSKAACYRDAIHAW